MSRGLARGGEPAMKKQPIEYILIKNNSPQRNLLVLGKERAGIEKKNLLPKHGFKW